MTRILNFDSSFTTLQRQECTPGQKEGSGECKERAEGSEGAGCDEQGWLEFCLFDPLVHHRHWSGRLPSCFLQKSGFALVRFDEREGDIAGDG